MFNEKIHITSNIHRQTEKCWDLSPMLPEGLLKIFKILYSYLILLAEEIKKSLLILTCQVIQTISI